MGIIPHSKPRTIRYNMKRPPKAVFHGPPLIVVLFSVALALVLAVAVLYLYLRFRGH